MIESLSPKVIHYMHMEIWRSQESSWNNRWIGLSKWEKLLTTKLTIDWNQQGENMGYKVVYFLKYDIFIALKVNIHQTTLHLVPTTREQTWVNKDTNHINVSKIEDTL